MARYAFIVVALPDDAPTDPQDLAARLSVGYDLDPTDAFGDIEDLSLVAYTSLADVVADEAEGCALNGYWSTGEVAAPVAAPRLALVA